MKIACFIYKKHIFQNNIFVRRVVLLFVSFSHVCLTGQHLYSHVCVCIVLTVILLVIWPLENPHTLMEE